MIKILISILFCLSLAFICMNNIAANAADDADDDNQSITSSGTLDLQENDTTQTPSQQTIEQQTDTQVTAPSQTGELDENVQAAQQLFTTHERNIDDSQLSLDSITSTHGKFIDGVKSAISWASRGALFDDYDTLRKKRIQSIIDTLQENEKIQSWKSHSEFSNISDSDKQRLSAIQDNEFKKQLTQIANKTSPDSLTKLIDILNPDSLTKLIDILNPDSLTKLIDILNPDSLTKLVDTLPEDSLKKMLTKLSPEKASHLIIKITEYKEQNIEKQLTKLASLNFDAAKQIMVAVTANIEENILNQNLDTIPTKEKLKSFATKSLIGIDTTDQTKSLEDLKDEVRKNAWDEVFPLDTLIQSIDKSQDTEALIDALQDIFIKNNQTTSKLTIDGKDLLEKSQSKDAKSTKQKSIHFENDDKNTDESGEITDGSKPSYTAAPPSQQFNFNYEDWEEGSKSKVIRKIQDPYSNAPKQQADENYSDFTQRKQQYIDSHAVTFPDGKISQATIHQSSFDNQIARIKSLTEFYNQLKIETSKIEATDLNV